MYRIGEGFDKGEGSKVFSKGVVFIVTFIVHRTRPVRWTLFILREAEGLAMNGMHLLK